MKQLSKETLQGMNKKQLYDYCRANKIKGYSNQNKAYITNLILQSYTSRKQPKKTTRKKPSGCKVCRRNVEIAAEGLCYDCYDKRFWKRAELHQTKKKKSKPKVKYDKWLIGNIIFNIPNKLMNRYKKDTSEGNIPIGGKKLEPEVGKIIMSYSDDTYNLAIEPDLADLFYNLHKVPKGKFHVITKHYGIKKSRIGIKPPKKPNFEKQVYKIYKKYTSKKGESMFIDTLEKELHDPNTFNKLWDLSIYGHTNIHLIVGRDTGKHKMYLKYDRGYTKFYFNGNIITI